MPTRFTRALLFLSSYSPLLLIVAVQQMDKRWWWSALPAAIGIVSCLWVGVFLAWARNTAPQPVAVRSVQRQDVEVMAYLFTYVIPFLSVNFDDLRATVGLTIFFIVLMVLYVHANMIHINPILALIGFHLWEIEDSNGNKITLISRRNRLLQGTEIKAVVISDDLLLEQS